MRKYSAYLLITAALLSSAVLEAQDSLRTEPPMTLKRAELLVPRTITKPVKSLIPGDVTVYDTLETSNPAIKLLLYSDNTWKYVRNGDLLKYEDYYTTNWSQDAEDAYRLPYDQLPYQVTLWLVDSVSQYSCPRQVKVYSKFGIRRGRRHQGVDLPLKTGEPVRAAFDGKVRMSKYTKGYGNLIVIRHENGLETFYGHLSRRDVEIDDWVTAGQVIGLGGSTGRSTGPHLHFETRYKGYAFDPERLIDFETGELRRGVVSLRRSYFDAGSRYVPESEEVEEGILLDEEAVRAEEERIAKEKAAMKYHTIKSGDTLGALAIKYHTTVKQLCSWNGISATTTLRLGQKLRVH